MPIRDLCSPDVLTTAPHFTVLDAAKLMARKNAGDIIVVENKKPVGILTDRDIVTKVLANSIDPDQCLISDVMEKNLVTAYEDDGLFQTIEKMQEFAIRRIPVIGNNGEIAGIISSDDLYQMLSEELGNLSSVSSIQNYTKQA